VEWEKPPEGERLYDTAGLREARGNRIVRCRAEGMDGCDAGWVSCVSA
jgi:hypothetical protein